MFKFLYNILILVNQEITKVLSIYTYPKVTRLLVCTTARVDSLCKCCADQFQNDSVFAKR